MGSIVIGLILVFIVLAIIRKLHNDRKAGKGACSGGCSACPSNTMCNSQLENLQIRQDEDGKIDLGPARSD